MRQLNMNITQTIVELRNQWDNNLSPREINDGDCDVFAEVIADQISNADVRWGDDICPILWSNKVIFLADWFTHFAPNHCIIICNNKYYDSECPQGCDYPDELPFYQRIITECYA